MLRPNRFSALLSLLVACWMTAPSMLSADPVVLVLDASGSMWGQVDGQAKIGIAREVLDEVLRDLPATTPVGLLAYGHRREGDCSDIEMLKPIGPLDVEALRETVAGIQPKGKTPISGSIAQALGMVRAEGGPASILLISDGLETCDDDPCGTARRALEGVDVRVHVVGFGLGDQDVSQLECLAEAGGGKYLPASSATELAQALQGALEEATGPSGLLRIGVTENGSPLDAMVVARPVSPSVDGEEPLEEVRRRTYLGPETNPLPLALPPGSWEIEVHPLGRPGLAPRLLGLVEIEEGTEQVRSVAFGTGVLSVGASRGAQLEDVSVRIYAAGTRQEVDAGRTYAHAKSNPKAFPLATGTVDVVLKAIKLSDSPERRFEGIEVRSDEPRDLHWEIAAGEISIETRGPDGALVEALVHVRDASGREVAAGRTSTDAKRNPRRFLLSPGQYKVTAKLLRGDSEAEGAVELVDGGEAAVAIALGGD